MPRTAQQILQEEFLIARAKILELAAIFDRVDRAARAAQPTSTEELDKFERQSELLAKGVAILQDSEPERASRVQALMSRPYDPNWREQWTI